MGGKEYPKNLPSGFSVQSELYRAKEKTEENKMERKKNEKYLEDTNSATYILITQNLENLDS